MLRRWFYTFHVWIHEQRTTAYGSTGCPPLKQDPRNLSVSTSRVDILMAELFVNTAGIGILQGIQ